MKKHTLTLAFNLILLLALIVGCKKKSKSEVSNRPAGKIVVLGSSTAFGVGASPSDSAWVMRLNAKLKQDKYNITVVNLASGGYSSYHIMPDASVPATGRPLPDAEKNVTKAIALNPDLVIINLPSNDIANNYSDAEIMSNFSVVTNRLKPANIQFIISGTQPRTLPADQQSRLVALNTSLSSAYGTNFFNYYGDLSTSANLIQPKYDTGDGVHLNNSGHYVIFDRLMKHPVFKDYLQKH